MDWVCLARFAENFSPPITIFDALDDDNEWWWVQPENKIEFRCVTLFSSLR